LTMSVSFTGTSTVLLLFEATTFASSMVSNPTSCP
jgi:hypothetical protein